MRAGLSVPPATTLLDYDLELAGVGKIYDSGAPAVIDFSLRVARGEFVAFLGPSGCGKTTTLRMIAGFETVTSGEILIRRRRINELPPERRPTSMIFQNYALFPHMTVRANVGFGLEVRHVPRAEREQRVTRMLSTLGLLDVAEQRTDRLSGGQRQRIALARGLVVEPDILLLDEPLGALDANLRKTIQAELKLLQRRLGITFVFVTHAQSEALTLSDRIVVMNAGRIEQVATPYELYTRPRTAFVARFIGRNTLLEGTVRDGVVETRFGRFAGRVDGPGLTGKAHLVIPSEAFDVVPEANAHAHSGNVLPGTVARREIVGHLAHMTVDLDETRSVTLQGHVDRYGTDPLAPSSRVLLAWRPEDGTIIAA